MPHLILVHQETKQDRGDYEEIARRIGAAGRSVRVFIADTKELDWQEAAAARGAPCLTVSPLPVKKFAPPRGPLLQGHEYPKSEQCERLRRIGVAVPRWTVVERDTVLDPREWGPYVVVKPDLGRKGAEIFIKRTGRVRYRSPDAFPPDHPGRKAPLLAQQFIYSGRWPVSYRVVTLFGRALLCWRCEANHRFEPLNSRWDFRARGGITVVSNKKDSRYELASDQDVIRLAQAAHAAFPDQPLLGCDIVRDADSGALYVLECNPRGDAWLISSHMGRSIEAANGLDFAAQFGALGIAAEVLADVTLQRAA
ncbi:MAG: hypothetical protein ACREUO_03675 [Burkholderiales bacterium]